MKTINYLLTGGNKILMQAQAIDKDTIFQLWYTGITSQAVELQVWISTTKEGPYAKVDAASKVLEPTDHTCVILLSGLSYGYVEFRLATANGTAGTVTNINQTGFQNYPTYP